MYTNKWFIIGVIFCIVMVAIGRNPVEESRQKREREMEGKDRLVESIKEHNDGKSKFKLGSLWGDDEDDKFDREKPVAPAPAGSHTQYKYPSYMKKQPAKGYSASGDFNQKTAQKPAEPQQPAQPQGYYPPPPLPDYK